MRYLLAAIFLCAIAMPEASALPTPGSQSISAAKADSITQIAKRTPPPSNRQASSKRKSGGSGLNGIHPLVGSGDY